MRLSDFWYAVGESRELSRGRMIGRSILGELVVLFRRADGTLAALQNRCLHRNAPLSLGSRKDDSIVCPYHGWRYSVSGRLTAIPSLTDPSRTGERCLPSFDVREAQGYVYVRLTRGQEEHELFAVPMLGAKGWQHVRLRHQFRNTVTNCAENFVDVPHTAWVHPRTFRAATQQQLVAEVTRAEGSVTVTYRNERHEGAFRRFLNANGAETRHVDRFLMPNVTCVEYEFGPRRKLFITSQSVPSKADETVVFTDITFDYGLWSWLARPFVRRRARQIIREDVTILGAQMEVIENYGGARFSNSPADAMHLFIESIRRELDAGRDPRLLPAETRTVEIVV